MRKIIFFGIAAVFTVGTAYAASAPINETVTLKNLDRAFEIAAADLGLTTVIYENECVDQKPAACSFHGQGQLEILGAAETVDSAPTSMTLIYTPDGDPAPFLLNVGLLVSIAEPDMAQEDRAKVITAIVRIAGGEDESSLVDGRNADYSVTNILGSIWVVAEKASD